MAPPVTNLTLPNGVTTIGDWAYNNCIHSTSVTIPGTVTRVGFSLAYCDPSTAVIFPYCNAPTTVGGSFGYAGAASEMLYYLPDDDRVHDPDLEKGHRMPVTTPSGPQQDWPPPPVTACR